jgi:hypothetical protein
MALPITPPIPTQGSNMAITNISQVSNSLMNIGCCPLTGGMVLGGTLLIPSIFDARGGYDQRKVAIVANAGNIHSGQILIAYLAADGLTYEIRANSLNLNNFDPASIASGASRIVVATTAYRAASGTPASEVNSAGMFYFNGGVIGNNMAKVIKFFDPALVSNTAILRVDSGDATIHHLGDVFIGALYKSGFTLDGRANRI